MADTTIDRQGITRLTIDNADRTEAGVLAEQAELRSLDELDPLGIEEGCGEEPSLVEADAVLEKRIGLFDLR